jgi:hypothetical protein
MEIIITSTLELGSTLVGDEHRKESINMRPMLKVPLVVMTNTLNIISNK